jgi:NAD-dependent deacetylase
MAPDYQAAAKALLGSRKVVIFTGAGMSKDSGIETFRGPGGIWERFNSEDLATVDGFLRDPVLVWKWYEHRRQQVSALEPHEGYDALIEMEGLFDEVVTVTQNIDGLHGISGADRVIELHGNIWKVRCSVEDRPAWEDRRTQIDDLPPHCERCGGLLRPHVVWFGEPLDRMDVLAANIECNGCDAMLVVGTSGIVYPAAGFPWLAKGHGARIVEVNIEPTPITEFADVTLLGPAQEVLPELVRTLRARMEGEGGSEGEGGDKGG